MAEVVLAVKQLAFSGDLAAIKEVPGEPVLGHSMIGVERTSHVCLEILSSAA